MKKICLFVIAALSLSYGCNKVEIPEAANGVMNFNVAHPATKASESSFEIDDKIGVYVVGYEGNKALPLQLGGNYKTNVPVTFDGRKWNANPVIYWDANTPKYNVYAYYPYMNPTSVDEMPFSVALDQRVGKINGELSAYEASDFLYASAKGVTADRGDVNLLFKHKLSKLTVNIIKGEYYEGDIPATATMYIHNTVTDCLIDLATGDVVKDPYVQPKTIVAKQVDHDTHTAIIVPQMLMFKGPLIEIIFKDVSYMIESKFNFKSGMHHTINVIMDRNPDKVKIEIGGEIAGWTN